MTIIIISTYYFNIDSTISPKAIKTYCLIKGCLIFSK